MKRFLFYSLINLVLALNLIPSVFPESSEDYQPIRTDMKLTFVYIIEHVEKKDRTWNVTVVKNSFPESLTFTWNKIQKDKPDSDGTRILTDLKTSRNFNPIFKKNESKATTDTAPWISLDVLKALRDKGEVEEFREGGSGAVNWAAATLSVKEKTIFPVLINGKPEALHALKLNKGLLIWNNLKNPLVLEYEPLGIPLFTSITGWKLVAIDY